MFRKILLLGILAGVGCSDGTTTSPTTSLDGVWRIISIQPASQTTQTAPVGAQYQVTFEDSRVVVRVDCNTCTGSYTAGDDTVSIGPTLACTRAACATAAFESAVLSLLGGEHQAASTLHNLTLSSNRGSILLQR